MEPTAVQEHFQTRISNNIRDRVARLLSDIEEGGNIINDIIQYRLDSLCKDVLEYRDYILNYDDVSLSILDAKQCIDRAMGIQESDTPRADAGYQPETTPAGGEDGVGRPKFQISEEQLRFFAGKFMIFCLILIYNPVTSCTEISL